MSSPTDRPVFNDRYEIHSRIRRGTIRTIREASGRYLFPDTEDTWAALSQLRAGAIKDIDLRQRHRDSKGHQYA